LSEFFVKAAFGSRAGLQKMCRRVTCGTCSKPTWAGCGMHIEQALAGVPVDERCKCERSSCVISFSSSASVPFSVTGMASGPRRG